MILMQWVLKISEIQLKIAENQELQFFNKKTEFDTVNSNYQFHPPVADFQNQIAEGEKKKPIGML